MLPQKASYKGREKGEEASQGLVNTVYGAREILSYEKRDIGLADTFRTGRIYTIERKKNPEKILICNDPEQKIDECKETKA
jgi:hypothetical protein